MKKILLLITLSFGMLVPTIAQNIPSYVPTNGLVGWWPFNGNANDESGNGNNGIVDGAILTTDRNGNANSAYKFQNTLKSKISVSNFNKLPISNSSYTVSGWFKNEGYNSGSIVYWGSPTANQNVELRLYAEACNNTPGIGTGWWNPNQVNYCSQNMGASNSWHFVTVTYNQNIINLFIDNVKVSSLTPINQPSIFNGNFNIGGQPWATGSTNGFYDYYFQGQLDDIAIYDRALTQEEISMIYTSTVPCTSPTASIIPQGATKINEGGNVVLKATTGAGYSYQWKKEGVAINGATDSIYIATTAGSYTVEVSSGACKATSSEVNVAVLPSYLPSNGLVGWWPFNGNANDESGNGNHGTVNGATLTSDRYNYLNRAYSFDGLNDKITSTIMPDFQDFSISFSFNSLLNQNPKRIIDMDNGGAYYFDLHLNTDGKLVAQIRIKGTQTDIISNSIVCDSKWHYGTFVRNNGNIKLYVDGNLEKSTLISTDLFVQPSPIVFGHTNLNSNSYTEQYFNGKLDDIAIYNRALSQQEISALYNSCTPPTAVITPKSTTNIKENESVVLVATKGIGYSYEWYKDGTVIPNAIDSNYTATSPGNYTVKISSSQTCDSTSAAVAVKRIYTLPNYLPTNGLVGWWPFNGNANDESGNENHGTVNGANLTSDRNGAANKAYNFDGNSNSIQIPDGPLLNNNYVSVSAWFQTNSNVASSIIYKTNNSAMNEQYACVLNYPSANVLNWSVKNGGNCNKPGVGWKAISPSKTVSDGIWHNIVTTYDGKISQLYIDGILILSNTFNTSILDNCGGVINIGKGYNSNYLFNGLLDDIAIYNRALTQQEISALYNSCTPPTAAITPKSSTNIKENESVVLSATKGNGYTYEWYKDGIAIPNAIDSNYTASTSGNYTVKISTSQTCDSTSAAVTVKRVYTLPTYLPTNGLVAWYPFNGNANDESGNENHGTVNGASLTENRNNQNNSAMTFLTNNDVIKSETAKLNNQNFTISLWFKLNQSFSSTTINLLKFGPYDASTYGGYGIRLDQNDQICGNGKYQAYAFVSTKNNYVTLNQINNYSSFLDLNKWNQYTFTKDVDVLSLYLNGILLNSMSFSSLTIDFQNAVLQIGNQQNLNSNNVGERIIDDISIYDRALTQQEITALYLGECNAFTAKITPQGPTTVCQGTPAVLNATTGTGFSYVWKKNNTVIAGASSASYSATTSGSYDVEITTPTGCKKTSENVIVIVKPRPAAGAIAGGNYVCKGTSIKLTPTIVGGVWSVLKPNLASIDQNGNVTGLMRTTQFVTDVVAYTVTNTEGCSSMAKRGLGIDSLPVVPVIAGPSKICSNGTVLYRSTNTANVSWTAGPLLSASSAYQGVFTHRVASNGTVPSDNYSTFVKATSYSINKVCKSEATKSVQLRTYASKNITMIAPSSLVVNATTNVSVTFPSGLTTANTSSRFWVSSASSVMSVAGTANLSTTVKALNIPTVSPRLYFSAIENSTGCGITAYKLFTVGAVSLVDAISNQPVSQEGIQLYPNPSNGRFTIENNDGATAVKLLDLTGRVVATQPITVGSTTVDFSGVSTGKYMLHLTGETINKVQSIIIE